MLTIWNYLSAFYTVVMVNCINPSNWSYCVNVHKWVPPYFGDLKRFYCEQPYEAESKYLLNFDKNL